VKRFEELQLMKFAWRQDISAWNSGLVEEVDLDTFRDMLASDEMEDILDENDKEASKEVVIDSN
jgi:hypothetical protein